MTKKDLEELKQIAIKNRIIFVSCIIIGALSCIAVLLFYQPRVTLDTAVLIEKQKQLEAIERNNAALQGLVEELKKGKEDLKKNKKDAYKQDSLLVQEVKLNRAAIQKIKIPNEKIKVFDSYGTTEWTTYFSSLPEPQR